MRLPSSKKLATLSKQRPHQPAPHGLPRRSARQCARWTATYYQTLRGLTCRGARQCARWTTTLIQTLRGLACRGARQCARWTTTLIQTLRGLACRGARQCARGEQGPLRLLPGLFAGALPCAPTGDLEDLSSSSFVRLIPGTSTGDLDDLSSSSFVRLIPGTSTGDFDGSTPSRWRKCSNPARLFLMLAFLALLSFVTLTAPELSAHPLAPALLKLEEKAQGSFEVTWRPPSGRPGGAALRPELPAECTASGEGQRRRVGRGFEQSWGLTCTSNLVGSEVAVRGLEEAQTEVLLSIQWLDGGRASSVLRPEAPAWTVPQKPSLAAVFWDYLRYGVTHILAGLDHLCFVLALVLLVPAPKRLFWTLTGFTLGHSITLALASLGVLSLPSIWTEAAIAASILVAAYELTRKGPTFLRRFPVSGATAFGLLHGLGFAGVLAEVGLPPGDLPLALAAFNVGIEVGQLLFVVVVWVLLRAATSLVPKRPAWTGSLPAYAIGTLAAFWLFQRLAAGFGLLD